MKRLWIFLLLAAFSLLIFNPTFAEISCDPSICPDQSQPDQRLSCLSEVTRKCEVQLQEARNQEKTLKSQLNLIDGQTKVTNLKIEETNLKIEKLKREINDLSTRIDRIGLTLDSLSEILLKRIVQTYKFSSLSTLDLIFSSQSIADLLGRLKYIQVAQSYDKKKLYELQATKLAYNDQKQDKQTRQQEAVKLNKDLENYKAQLEQQKQSKVELLKITQNNEAIYQQKIRVAQEEQNAILAIFRGGGNEVTVGPVKVGDTVGHIISGRSACSSGTHLHFEVHQNSSLSDPNNYLSGTSFSYGDNDGGASEGTISPHGSWSWPIFPDIFISQGFGMTPYARAGAYNGGPHTGIDMYSSSGLTVKAVVDGTLSRGGIACGSGTLYYKKIDQGNGISAYYLHVLD